VHIPVFLAFVKFLNVFFRICLHGGPIVSYRRTFLARDRLPMCCPLIPSSISCNTYSTISSSTHFSIGVANPRRYILLSNITYEQALLLSLLLL
jgi:hypothetical protein